MTSRVRMWGAVLAKLTITFALLAWLLGGVDWSRLFHMIAGAPYLPLIIAIVLLFSITVPVTRRWHLIVAALGNAVSFTDAFRMVLMTVLLNQSVPSNLGGDAYRILAMTRTGMSWTRATLAAIIDRLIALVALALIAFVGILSLLDLAGLENQRLLAFAGTVAIVGGVVTAWLFFRSELAARLSDSMDIVRRLIAAMGTLLSNPAEAIYLLALSIVVQCITVGVMGLVAANTGVNMPLLPMLGVCALGLLIARLPVSYGGWGVREGTLVLGFAPFGVSREAALAASITYGLTELAAAVIGGLVWLVFSLHADARLEKKGQA